MTMVALLGHPVKSASPLPHATPHTLSQMPREPIVTHPTPPPQETINSYPTAALRDIPTDVSTTAATSDAYDVDDDDRCRTHQSIDDDNSTPDSPFFPDWDEFYKDFKLFIHSTDASIVSTPETLNHTTVSAGSVVAANDHAAAEPDHITFLKELDALHDELTMLLLPRTSLPQKSEEKHVTSTDATYDDHNNTVPISAEPTNIDILHQSQQHHDYGFAYHPNDNHDNDDRENNTTASADGLNDDSGTKGHRHNNHNTDNKEYTDHAATRDNDGCTRHRQQYTPTFPTIGHATPHQHQIHTVSAPSATTPHQMTRTPTGVEIGDTGNNETQQFPRPTPTENKPNSTLPQLWVLLAQLEVINHQFATWLDTFPSEKSLTTPDNTPGNSSNLSSASSATTLTIIRSTPSLPNKQPAHPLFAICVSDPIGRAIHMSPSDRHSPAVRAPPWPPPMSQSKGRNPVLQWHLIPITNLLPTSDDRILRPKPYGHNPIWPSLVLNHIHYPSDFRNTNAHQHVHFRTLTRCHPGPTRFWPKEDMRPP